MTKIDMIALKVGTPSFLTDTIELAIDMAIYYNAVILFSWEGIRLSVTAKDKVEDIEAFYESEFKKKPEAKTYKEKHI